MSWAFQEIPPLLPMKSELKAFFRSFTYAAEGIVNALRTERNMRFHACAAVTVIVFSRIYGLTRTENCIMLLCIGLVIGAELLNTAVEGAADIMSQGEHSPEAKKAKDCGAGAVLVCAAVSAVCGIVLFGDVQRLGDTAGWFAANPPACAAAAVWLAAAFVFIFGKRKGNIHGN